MKKIEDPIVLSNGFSLKRLFDLYFTTADSFASSILSTNINSKDIVEDVFVKIWERELVFDNIYKFKAYLYNSIKNSCINELKKRKTLKNIDQEIFQQTIEDRIIITEIESQLIKSINSLPPKRKEVMNLKIQGLTIKEIAEELGISHETAKVHLRLARKHIKDSSQLMLLLFLKKNQKLN